MPSVDDILGPILGGATESFALLRRPGRHQQPTIEVLVGPAIEFDTLDALPIERSEPPVLTAIPYRQVGERGLDCRDDHVPIRVLRIEQRAEFAVDDLLSRLPAERPALAPGWFDIDDASYGELVRQVIAEEIGNGEGSNFVIKRCYISQIEGDIRSFLLAAFRRLVEEETGSYWTFLACFGSTALLGASPELHISLVGETVTMNPISGTYRFPATGPDKAGLLSFLADEKEADELYMVAEEELKMMASVCPTGGRLSGPHLKEMSRVAHTEYVISGVTRSERREILRQSMFAPSVVGSPLANACRVVARREPTGRSYYAGVIALFDNQPDGGASLDSAILIRSAEIDDAGRVSVGVGATIVRDSDPASEIAETEAKAAAVMSALVDRPSPAHGPAGNGSSERRSDSVRLGSDPQVEAVLARRNRLLNQFWLAESADGLDRAGDEHALAGKRALILDAEDDFTAMVACQLRALGLSVDIRPCGAPGHWSAADLVVAGPGPGDPTSAEPRMERLRAVLSELVSHRRPFLALCLSHQILCSLLGFELIRLAKPNQGRQRTIELFGQRRTVGFYNTFQAMDRPAALATDRRAGRLPASTTVAVASDPDTDEIYGLRGPAFVSLQFHPESLLTQDGFDILRHELGIVLGHRSPLRHLAHTRPLKKSPRV